MLLTVLARLLNWSLLLWSSGLPHWLCLFLGLLTDLMVEGGWGASRDSICKWCDQAGVWHQPSVTGAAALFALPLPRPRFTPERSPNVQACAETWRYSREAFPELILSVPTSGWWNSHQVGFWEISDFPKTEKKLVNVKDCSGCSQQRGEGQRLLSLPSPEKGLIMCETTVTSLISCYYEVKRSTLLSTSPQVRRGSATWRGSTTKRRWGPSWCSTWRGAPPSRRCLSGSTTWTARWSWPTGAPSRRCCSPTSATRRRRASTAKRSWTISAKRLASWAGSKPRPRWEIE